MKRNPEIHLLIKILAIIGFIILLVLIAGYIFIKVRSPYLLEFSKGIEEYRIPVKLDSLKEARFITGMNGCENILPQKEGEGVYVSCLDGNIHFLVPDINEGFKIKQSFRAGEAVMGMTFSADGELFAAVSKAPLSEWSEKGGGVYRITADLLSAERISEDFPSMNGICIDGSRDLYFTTSNFNLLRPKGAIYRIKAGNGNAFGSPEIYIPDAGAANGLYYDPLQDEMYYSNTLGGVYGFTSDQNSLQEVYLKLKFMEACDDLCTDISGNIWMTDPGQSTIKVFNPGTGRLVRFIIEGIGQTSSCRIRSEKGGEILYITELKRSQSPMSSEFTGRGVLIVPAQSLLKLLEPVLTEKKQQR